MTEENQSDTQLTPLEKLESANRKFRQLIAEKGGTTAPFTGSDLMAILPLYELAYAGLFKEAEAQREFAIHDQDGDVKYIQGDDEYVASCLCGEEFRSVDAEMAEEQITKHITSPVRSEARENTVENIDTLTQMLTRYVDRIKVLTELLEATRNTLRSQIDYLMRMTAEKDGTREQAIHDCKILTTHLNSLLEEIESGVPSPWVGNATSRAWQQLEDLPVKLLKLSEEAKSKGIRFRLITLANNVVANLDYNPQVTSKPEFLDNRSVVHGKFGNESYDPASLKYTTFCLCGAEFYAIDNRSLAKDMLEDHIGLMNKEQIELSHPVSTSMLEPGHIYYVCVYESYGQSAGRVYDVVNHSRDNLADFKMHPADFLLMKTLFGWLNDRL